METMPMPSYVSGLMRAGMFAVVKRDTGIIVDAYWTEEQANKFVTRAFKGNERLKVVRLTESRF